MMLRPRKSELAKLFGVPLGVVTTWGDQGQPQETLYEAVEWYFKNHKIEKDDLTKLKEELLKTTIETKQKKVLSRTTVLEIVEGILGVVKEEILGFPGGLAPIVEGTQEEKYAIIERYCKECLTMLVKRIEPYTERVENGAK